MLLSSLFRSLDQIGSLPARTPFHQLGSRGKPLEGVVPHFSLIPFRQGNHSVKYWFIASVIRWIGSSTSAHYLVLG